MERRGPAIIAWPPLPGTTLRSRLRAPKPPPPGMPPGATTRRGDGQPGGGAGGVVCRRGGRWWARGRLHFREGGIGGGENWKRRRGTDGQCARVSPTAHFRPPNSWSQAPRLRRMRCPFSYLLAHPTFSPLLPVNARVHTPGNALARGPALSTCPDQRAEVERGITRFSGTGKVEA